MEKEERIKIFPLKPEDKLNETEFSFIQNTLEAKQRYVGGTIQAICFDTEHSLNIICNDDGKLLGLPMNRAWVVDGKVIDVIVGDALICRHKGAEFCSIHEEDKEIILNTFMPIIAYLKGKFAVINAKGELEILEMYE